MARLVTDGLRARGLWTAERLTEAVGGIDHGLAASCREGFQALETGKGWSAIHVLVPQLERAVRLVARASGASLTARQAGGLRWSSLEMLLDDAIVSSALGQALATALRRLYVHPYGPNYRNDLAHGAMDPSASHDAVALLTTLAILSVALRKTVVASGRAEPEPDDHEPATTAGDAAPS